MKPALKRAHGVTFLKLRGDTAERARQHGELLREEIARGPLPLLAKRNHALIREAAVGGPLVAGALTRLYDQVILRALYLSSGREARVSLEAIAEASGLPLKECIACALQPEGMMVLARLAHASHVLEENPIRALPGCSSGVALPHCTKSGKLLVGRNMDYPVVGRWEENPLVIFHEPSERHRIPHVSVSSVGIHTAGITAMNAEGITLTTHAHFGRGVSLVGKPIVTIGDELIQKSRTLDEAIDIARGSTRIGNWAFVVSSAKDKMACVIEMSPTRTEVRYPEEGLLAHSNYFQSSELHGEELLISGAYRGDVESRACRMYEILKSKRGEIEPTDLMQALGDQVDAETGERRIVGNTISVVTAVKSVVMNPADQILYIANRNESPVSWGEYFEIPFSSFWETEASELKSFRADQAITDEARSAMQSYRQAYRAWQVDFAPQSTHADRAPVVLGHLRDACQKFPSDGNLWLMRGLIAFTQALWDEARQSIEAARAHKLGKHVSQVALLYSARCQDIAGYREGALDLYRSAGEISDPKLREAFQDGIKRRYDAGRARKIQVDLQLVDSLGY